MITAMRRWISFLIFVVLTLLFFYRPAEAQTNGLGASMPFIFLSWSPNHPINEIMPEP
jgi:hypothetical protein